MQIDRWIIILVQYSPISNAYFTALECFPFAHTASGDDKLLAGFSQTPTQEK